MKELSIKEKAKAYDEAIKIAIAAYKDEDRHLKATLERIFPELKESEDEKIRQLLLRFVKYDMSDNYSDDFTPADCVAWLEKQGENTHNKELSELLHKVICRFINDPNIPYTEREKVSMEIIPYVERLEKQGEQKPAEWSEYDEKIKELIIKASDDGCLYGYVDSEHLLDWLNSIKSRYTLYPIINKDNKVLNSIIEHFEHERNMYDDDESKEQIDEEINWLKSLRPQNRWKPSDEQMDALHYVTNFDYGGHKATLVSLYEQLKKLKG